MRDKVFFVPKGNGDCFTITAETVIYDAMTRRIILCGNGDPPENNCLAMMDANDYSAVINAEWSDDLEAQDIAKRVFGRDVKKGKKK